MSVTVTNESNPKHDSKIRKISIAWVSAADGSATGTFQAHGYLVKVITDPGATAPTADYDITLVDEYGFDAAGGALADRHTSTTQAVYPIGASGGVVAPLMHGTHTFTVANAGDSKVGTCILFIAQEI